jgi:hypothetical protein
MEKHVNQERILKELEFINTVICNASEGNMNTDGMYLCSLRAALVKNFEFNCLIFSDGLKINAFALNPSLRGLCEDIICLKYLNRFTPQDRDEAVYLLSTKQIFLFVEKQQNFFSVFHPSQSILANSDLDQSKTGKAEAKKLRLKLASFRLKYGWTSKKDWPTVREMAESSDLLALYDYLYAATSSFVHFSPHNLMRMGWGDIKTKSFQYSTRNFESYYSAFNQIYGICLFITFCTSFASALSLKEDIKPTVEKLILIVQEERRWPELVTFEEMNWFDTNPIKTLFSPFMIAGGKGNSEIRPKVWQWA